MIYAIAKTMVAVGLWTAFLGVGAVMLAPPPVLRHDGMNVVRERSGQEDLGFLGVGYGLALAATGGLIAVLAAVWGA